jgi:calcineurin-like phosphoesterase family protein|tara:strand:+ start:819 stop:1079 length:261 start_codon:yes stop_codon:yes gene_type:complete
MKIKWKPSRGYRYLESLNPGDRFLTESNLEGILVSCNVNANVIITDVPSILEEEDEVYYLGKKIISAKTEVKEIGNVNDGMDTLSG